jgi:hypothetical protein
MNESHVKQSWVELQERLDSQEYRVQLLCLDLVIPDVPRRGAAKMYRRNYHGCRDLWKLRCRLQKERRMTRT